MGFLLVCFSLAKGDFNYSISTALTHLSRWLCTPQSVFWEVIWQFSTDTNTIAQVSKGIWIGIVLKSGFPFRVEGAAGFILPIHWRPSKLLLMLGGFMTLLRGHVEMVRVAMAPHFCLPVLTNGFVYAGLRIISLFPKNPGGWDEAVTCCSSWHWKWPWLYKTWWQYALSPGKSHHNDGILSSGLGGGMMSKLRVYGLG